MIEIINLLINRKKIALGIALTETTLIEVLMCVNLVNACKT